MRVRQITATGNAASDTANIQGAADALSSDNDRESGCTILAGGDYRVNEPLTFGSLGPTDDPYNGSLPPMLIATSQAHLTWEGEETDESMITWIGTSKFDDLYFGAGPHLANLALWCDHKCRGLRVQRLPYANVMQSIRIESARRIALDCIDCWGGSMGDIYIRLTDGVCARIQGFHSGTLRNIKTQTVTQMGSGGDFPPTEEDFHDYKGDKLAMPTDHRAALYIRSGMMIADNILAEGADLLDAGSAVHLHSCSGLSMRNLRLEGADCTEQYIKVTALGGGSTNHNISIDSVGGGEDACKYLMKVAGHTRGISLTRMNNLSEITDAIMILDQGVQSGHRVSHVYAPGGVGLDKWMVIGDGNPTMSGEITADSDHSVSIPWQ